MGWFKTAITLVRAVLIPSLTYSADVWISMNRATEKLLHEVYKAMVFIVMDIPTKTKWASFLADLGLPNIMAVVNKLRVNYVSHNLWRNGDEKLKELLLEEHRLMPERIMLSQIDSICLENGLPRVSEVELDKNLVKWRIKLGDETDIWASNVSSPVTQNVSMERIRQAARFYTLNKREAQALIAYNAGALKLKTAWGDYHEVQECLAVLCGEKDEIEHIKKCNLYETKWKSEYDHSLKSLDRFLVTLDLERRQRWRKECLF